MGKIILKSVPAVVIKNGDFTLQSPKNPGDWDFKTHDIYKQFNSGDVCNSIQISDQKDIYKMGGLKGAFKDFPFQTNGRIVITFESEK